MLNVVYLVVGILVCLLIPVIVIKIIERKKKKKINLAYKILFPILVTLVVLFATGKIYVSIYSKANKEAYDYLKTTNDVKVINDNHRYLFDGKGEKDLIIFYPGAKVETKAYAPLLYKIAEAGYDCYLVNMPFRLAFFGMDNANYPLNSYKYESYYMMGHSLGGVISANYLSKSTNDKFKGIIFLASYPATKLDDKYSSLLIYGSNDGVLNLKQYNDHKSNWPTNSKEVIINGGNHTGFASYDLQKGDNKATISMLEQINICVDAIKEFIK